MNNENTINASNLQCVAHTITPKHERKVVERGCLVLTVACAALSLIPPLKFGASIAMRAVALLSSSVNCLDRWNSESDLGRLGHIAKIALFALGIAAIAASMPILLVASLVTDIGLQAIEGIKAATDGDGKKALTHLAIIVIDGLGLAALLTGMWELMVASAAVTALAMLVLAIKVGVEANSCNAGDVLDATCYTALSAFGGYMAYSGSKSG